MLLTVIILILILLIIVYWYSNNGDTIKLKLTEINSTDLYASIPQDVFDKIQLAIMNGKNSIKIKKTDYKKILQKTEEIKKHNERIDECSYLNNKGSDLEKEGKIQEAIITYERNINDKYPATHSYERLMVLYRKSKDYDNELRIINSAIDVFGKENEKKFSTSIKDKENKKYLPDIQIAHETNTGFKNDDGWYIYCPYNIMKYIERLEKVKNLMKRNIK